MVESDWLRRSFLNFKTDHKLQKVHQSTPDGSDLFWFDGYLSHDGIKIELTLQA